MFFDRLRRKVTADSIVRVLHDAAVAQSRQPALYSSMGAPDTVEGRFELLTLHVILLLDRLKDEQAIRQALFDTYVSDLDGALREMGVGDLSVGKRMKGLGAVFYGRAKAFDEAFKALPDEAILGGVIARTIFQDVAGTDPAPLAAYARLSRERLATLSMSALLAGEIAWAAL
jgi:cytochrome b pre-mRNA-processing protein 3